MGVARITAGPITVVANKTYRIAIDAPPRGEIIQAQCIQTAGSNTTFSFAFYNSARSCPPGGPVDTATDPMDKMVEYEGQIGPTRVVATAKDRYVLADGSDGGWATVIPYCNADRGHSDAARKLYMKFMSGGAGTYSLFITVKTTRD